MNVVSGMQKPLLVCTFVVAVALAQVGSTLGKVCGTQSGEGLAGATVMMVGTKFGASAG